MDFNHSTDNGFLSKEQKKEEVEEQAAMFDEILIEVTAEREAAGLSENLIQACAEAMRRLREEVKKTNLGVAK